MKIILALFKTPRQAERVCEGYIPAVGAPSDALMIQKSSLQVVDGLHIPLRRTRAALFIAGDDDILTGGADVNPLRRHPTREHAHHGLHNLNRGHPKQNGMPEDKGRKRSQRSHDGRDARRYIEDGVSEDT